MLISSEYWRTSKFVACGIPRCEVKKFERGKNILIKHYILQIETYFMTSQIPVERMVNIMVKKIAPNQFDEFRPYIQFVYLEFREKLFEVFGDHDTIHAKLQENSRVVQFRDESIADYMHRVRMLEIRAHHDVRRSEQE